MKSGAITINSILARKRLLFIIAIILFVLGAWFLPITRQFLFADSLSKGGLLRINVVDDVGLPIANDVAIHAFKKSETYTGASLIKYENGYYVLVVPPGDYAIQAAAQGYKQQSRDIRIDDGTNENVLIILPKQ